jgi:CHAD domain-containing protein
MNTNTHALTPERPPMEAYAASEAARLLQKFADQVEVARGSSDPDAVHDLRVSIRRFGQCLRVFRQFFPASGRRRVRRRLKKVMRRAAEVRNRDIAMDLLVSLGVAKKAVVLRRMAAGRAEAASALGAALDRWSQRGSAAVWRARLEL